MADFMSYICHINWPPSGIKNKSIMTGNIEDIPNKLQRDYVIAILFISH